MNKRFLSNLLHKYEAHLMYDKENVGATVKKYVSEAKKFLIWLYDIKHLTVSDITKKVIMDYKEYLHKSYNNYHTINVKLGINHIFLVFISKGDITISRFKTAKRICKPNGRYVKEKDYMLLRKCSKIKLINAVLAVNILANTGVRVSELKYFTVESVTTGIVTVINKGKIRDVVLNPHIRRDILKFCRKQSIKTGPVLINRRKEPYTRFGIWRMLKRLAEEMGVDLNVVFPHSFRHLFAVKHYSIYRDIECLSRILGHDDIDTTMTYLQKTAEEYGITMDIWYKSIKKATEH
jgi:site-specific recombinase XerD